jgi:hypothetical protein
VYTLYMRWRQELDHIEALTSGSNVVVVAAASLARLSYEPEQRRATRIFFFYMIQPSRLS